MVIQVTIQNHNVIHYWQTVIISYKIFHLIITEPATTVKDVKNELDAIKLSTSVIGKIGSMFVTQSTLNG